MANGWNPGPTIAVVLGRLRQRLARVGAAMEAHAKELVSRPNPPVRGPRGGKARGINPSLPGEPPKKVFGHLRSAIAFEVVSVPGFLVLRFGVFRGSTASAYAAALEFGFHGARHIAPHTRSVGPGFSVIGTQIVRGKRQPRFRERQGPPLLSGVKGFVRAYLLEARPYIRPTFAHFQPRVPMMLNGGS